jgi:hypothetical protein
VSLYPLVEQKKTGFDHIQNENEVTDSAPTHSYTAGYRSPTSAVGKGGRAPVSSSFDDYYTNHGSDDDDNGDDHTDNGDDDGYTNYGKVRGYPIFVVPRFTNEL